MIVRYQNNNFVGDKIFTVTHLYQLHGSHNVHVICIWLIEHDTHIMDMLDDQFIELTCMD